MANKDLKEYAHQFRQNEDVWWFEESDGIHLWIDWVINKEEFVIPWRTIRAALARKDKK